MSDGSVKFLNKTWFLRVTRNVSLFQNSIITSGYIKCYKKFNVLPNEAVYIVKNGQMTWAFINKENMEKYAKKLEKLYKKPETMIRMERTYYYYGKRLMHKSNKLKNRITRNNYFSYIQAAKDMSPGFQVTNQIGVGFLQILMEKIKKLRPDLNQQEIDILISDLTYPDKQTLLTQSQKLLLEIGAELQRRKLTVKDIFLYAELKKKFSHFMNKFSFIPVNFNEEAWTEKEILDQIKQLMKKDCQKELEKIVKNNQEKKKKSRQLLAEINDREIMNLVKAIQKGTYLNEYRKYVFCHASLSYRSLFERIAEKYNLTSWKECWKFTPREIEQLYFGEKTKILNVLPSRDITGVCFSNNKEGYRLLSKKEINLFLKEIDKKSLNEKGATSAGIKGTIANRGVIRGMVKIIYGKYDFHKFRDGDIIVTTMTSVDFVPLMKRAAAYVTNEGGITCHASIVSRELGKPCIVGTRIATQVLKDGDLVEVDANEGIVRVIK